MESVSLCESKASDAAKFDGLQPILELRTNDHEARQQPVLINEDIFPCAFFAKVND